MPVVNTRSQALPVAGTLAVVALLDGSTIVPDCVQFELDDVAPRPFTDDDSAYQCCPQLLVLAGAFHFASCGTDLPFWYPELVLLQIVELLR